MTYWQPADRFGGVIDVSHHNGAIDWPRVKAAGIELAFIKATQGDGYTDPLFVRNRDGALAAGLMIAPYHFVTEHDAAAQCRHFLAVAGNGGPVMVDWEIDPSVARRPPIATMEQVCRILKAALGRDPLAYHGMYDLSSPQINAYPWMVPKYGSPPQGPRWLFWQYTPSGAVDGIAGPVDRSVFAGTLDELRVWYQDGTLPASLAAPDAPQSLVPVSNVETAVRQLQEALQARGFDPGPIDGDPGPRTQAACEAWRRR